MIRTSPRSCGDESRVSSALCTRHTQGSLQEIRGLKTLPRVLFKVHLKLGLCSVPKGSGSAAVWEE